MPVYICVQCACGVIASSIHPKFYYIVSERIKFVRERVYVCIWSFSIECDVFAFMAQNTYGFAPLLHWKYGVAVWNVHFD